jgi:hypothetical protein
MNERTNQIRNRINAFDNSVMLSDGSFRPDICTGDMVSVHGEICEVILEDASGEHGGFVYQNLAGEELFYSFKSKINPEPKKLWILE